MVSIIRYGEVSLHSHQKQCYITINVPALLEPYDFISPKHE
jgi:hypothetical protein